DLGGDADRRARLAPQRRRRRFVHRDDVRRVDDAKPRRVEIVVAAELGVDRVATADEHDAQIEMPRRRQRAVDDRTRSEIAAHRVNCDPDHWGSGFAVRGSGSGFWGSGFWFSVLGFWAPKKLRTQNENPERRTPNPEPRPGPTLLRPPAPDGRGSSRSWRTRGAGLSARGSAGTR